jgi:hypothetical protein
VEDGTDKINKGDMWALRFGSCLADVKCKCNYTEIQMSYCKEFSGSRRIGDSNFSDVVAVPMAVAAKQNVPPPFIHLFRNK